MKQIKELFKYIFFQDMGNLGEGWLISGFIWFVIISIIVNILR